MTPCSADFCKLESSAPGNSITSRQTMAFRKPLSLLLLGLAISTALVSAASTIHDVDGVVRKNAGEPVTKLPDYKMTSADFDIGWTEPSHIRCHCPNSSSPGF